MTERQFTVYVKGQAKSFTSTLSDAAALAKLATLPGNFAQELYAKSAKGLSPLQMAWVHKLVVDALAKESTPPVVKVGNGAFKAIVSMLAKAGAHLKYPKITLSDGTKLYRAGQKSKRCGWVYVILPPACDGERGEWYAAIDPDGNMERRTGIATRPELDAVLSSLASDPVATLAAQGKASGNCCYCNKKLTTPESMGVGYGPVCADHYGLPWGETKLNMAALAGPTEADKRAAAMAALVESM